jgi:hypothetical protein
MATAGETAAKPPASASGVAKKLFIKPGYKIGTVEATAGLADALGALPEGASLSDAQGENVDTVIAFVRKSEAVAATLATASRALKPEGLLWVCYLKGGAKAGTDLNRDSLYQQMKTLGYQGIGQVALDDSWSAMRFKPAQ